MTQLIVNGTDYPELMNGRYKSYIKANNKTSRMASGRLVTEVGYKYRVLEVGPYDCLSNTDKETILTHMRSGSDLTVVYLPDDGEATVTGTFKCTSLTPPVYLWQNNGVSFWRGISFVLEGVDAID